MRTGSSRAKRDSVASKSDEAQSAVSSSTTHHYYPFVGEFLKGTHSGPLFYLRSWAYPTGSRHGPFGEHFVEKVKV